ncbi:hypothetical protein DH2020_000551 [Rehmannia glutinosa]|uniref:Uncharacterized protein n=1 Tax=Rehmannia glutinosa TaxID=99300 RepID=A0ABR0XWS7_REHGL
MHGCRSTSVLIVNAEVDSMGGVVEGGVGIANKTSPRKAAIEKVQAELWQEYGVRDQRKRELEFLEKGGDPLDFKRGRVVSVSVQSTSITDHHPNQFVTSEAKGSFAFTASPHGDSVESCGRPGTTPCEPNSADNLMLFDVERGFSEGCRSLSHPSRSDVAPSEQSFQMDGSHKTQEHGDLAAFGLPRKAYKRRYRSRLKRDGARSSSSDVNPTHGCHVSSLPSRHGPRDVKGLVLDAENQNISLNWNSKPTNPMDDTLPKTVFADGQDEIELDGLKSVESTKDLVKGVSVRSASDNIASENPLDEQLNQQSLSTAAKPPNQVDSNGPEAIQGMEEITSAVIESDKCVKEKKDIEGINSSTLVNKESASDCQRQQDNGFSHQLDEELNESESVLENKVKDLVIVEGMEDYGCTRLESGRKLTDPSVDNPGLQNETSYDDRHQDSVDASNADLPEAGSLTKVSAVTLELQTSSGSDSKLASKIVEDSILKEAQIIQAKRKRIAELSIVTSPTEIRRKSHWDYVLEEMAWLANDFSQERIWKIAAASQISYRVAVACRSRKQEKRPDMDAKTVAHTLAKAVMEFWHSVEVTSKELEQQHQKNRALSVRAYAVRLLKCIKPHIFHNQAEVPLTPDRISDLGTLDLSSEDNLTEENLFYTVLPGVMETYRMSVESHVAHCEKIGNTVQEEVETSVCDAAAEFDSQDNAYDEDDGETSIYNMPVAFEGSKSSRYGQKKRKHLTHAYGPRSYEIGSDLFPVQCAENKVVTQQSALLAKRPGSTLNVSIPTKRVRTASRRVISPFTAGASGCIQVPIKTDVSSCDTNSFQDDQSTIHGGLLFPNSMEVESAGNFEKQLPFDSIEVSTKPKKKKKAKHLNAAYDQRWQVDSSFQNEQFQRDPMKRDWRIINLSLMETVVQLFLLQASGLLGQPMIKKPKLMRQSQDNSFDNIPPSGGSVPSPATSQMSNMSNPNKFIKMLGGRDRGRKAKAVKMPAGQPGSGSPWSLFEDQALVVLVHDLGPNWELVGDAINSTLHFKCIFRKAKECKERHSFLMDGTSADGAESADDSGSSQPYPSTLPGIRSARQLFQRLQGPMEEDTLKSHFEKIIMIGQKQHYRKTQATFSWIGYTKPGYCDSMLPASGASSALQGSPNMMIGNSFPSSPGPPNPSASRDGRYVVPRSGSLSTDEQQRMQQYNQMMPGRHVPQPNISAPGALPGTDRGVRIVPGGNGMGVMGGVNRSLPVGRPGFQGVNSDGMVSPVMSSANMHSGVGASQGSSMLKPRETLHMMRPDFQMPGNSQGVPHFSGRSSPSPPVSSYPLHHQPSHPISPQQPQLLSPHPTHFQGPPNHAANTQQQQAYAIRLAKETQLQHRRLQQQQLAASNSLMPHVHSQPQLPISSPIQNNSPQTSSSPPVSVSSINPMPQHHQQKHQTPNPGGVVRKAEAGGSGGSGLTNQKRQRQQHQLSQANNRQHPQQRQQLQAQQQAKAAKGVGRGNPLMHQNVLTDASLLNGVSTNPGQYVASQSTNQSLPQHKIYSAQASSSSNNQHAPYQQKLVNQNQSVLQRVVQPNRQIVSDPSTKPQGRDSDTNQHPTSSSAEVDIMTTLPQVSNNATNAVQVVSSPGANKWHASEPLVESNALNSPMVSMPSNSTFLCHRAEDINLRRSVMYSCPYVKGLVNIVMAEGCGIFVNIN